MNKFLRIGLLEALACTLLLLAGCPAKRLDSGDVPSSGDTDSSLPRLSGEALRAADQIGNGKIFFEFDKYEIKQESKQILTKNAGLLKQFPQIKVKIEGHCDERGTEEYNLALGERRARAAYEFLVLMGIDSSKLQIISYGEEYPAVQGSNEAAWSKNRRDEFKASAN